MTRDEIEGELDKIEGELHRLRKQVSQLQQQQERKKSIGFGGDSSRHASAWCWQFSARLLP
jgi:hypothetical protein